MNIHIDNLTKLYSRWLEVNNLPQHLSAEDLLYESNTFQIKLTDNQHQFLRSFINVWCEIDNLDFENNNKMVWDKISVCPDTKATTYKYK